MTTTQVLVCWSGGCDSTLLLHHAARAYGTPSEPVRTISLTTSQVTSGKREAVARRCLLKVFAKQGLHIEPMELELSTTTGAGIAHHGLPQAVLWLLATQALRAAESLSLGYIRGDDWAQHVEAYRKVFSTLQGVSDRTGTLWLPLLGSEKRGVLDQLRKLKLLDLCWWCEVPATQKGTKPCGTCHSCATHATGLWKLEQFGAGFSWDGGVE